MKKLLTLFIWLFSIISIWYCEYTQIECEENYSLIPLTEINNEYCEINNLCNVYTWNSQISWDIARSSIFINDIQHESRWNINIYIPEEISRNYTWNEETIDIYINGYNVDNEYISQIIENEKMTPTADDFSYLIENLGDYIPLLCIAGLMITARYIFKKVF